MVNRGRPIKSEIRQNVIDILYFLGEGYGYDIYRIYRQLYPKCTKEVIYYHLRKGAKLGEFILKEVRKEEGDYSWGQTSEKKIYTIGPEASPRIEERVKEFIEKLKEERKTNS